MQRNRSLARVAALALAASLSVTTATAGTAAAAPASGQASPARRLTNLAHLNFLTDSVTPPAQAGHDTYHLDTRPAIGVLWVYANHETDGSYRRVGGGTYDAGSNTYGQGAYDADDLARAAIVYLRHWKLFGDAASKDRAVALLRGLTYMQTNSGPNAGNVVLWMQPDGTLNPSATPKDNPDPSDSNASFWLARTIWALGEGYADLRTADPDFARFVKARLDLAVGALKREVLTRYGRYHHIDGMRMPSWLIADGADASSEAVLGLSAYLGAGGGPAARTALAELADGIAAMAQGSTRTWPYGAVFPAATSRSMWHAWGAQMPSALAAAAVTLHRPRLLSPAIGDAASFTPHLLTATGPDNGWLPAPVDSSQIAYGADARVQGLLAVGAAARSAGLVQLAGFAAGWFFGQNPAGAAMYDPGTGVTHDGVNSDRTVNLNSGAESTIHGLLTMESLDAHPALIRLARAGAHIVERDGQRTVEAEAASLTGPATVVHPTSAWTGESQWSGGAYVQVGGGSQLRWTVPGATQPRMVQAVINRVPGRAGTTRFDSVTSLGEVRYGGGAPQGASPAPGALLPITLAGNLPARATSLTATTAHGSGQLDAVLITPLVSTLVTSGGGHGLAVLASVAGEPRRVIVDVPGTGTAHAASYDSHGRLWRTATGAGPVTVDIPPGGFAVAWR
ncbi:MAG: hypothetical protein WCB04_02285 [Mycobacteriales bacterium]